MRDEGKRRKRRFVHQRTLSDYRSRENPYFAKHVPRRSFSGYGKWYVISLIAVTIVLVSYSPFFHVENIEVAGAQEDNRTPIYDIAGDFLHRSRWMFFRQENSLYVDEERMEAFLSSELQELVPLETVHVRTILPDTVIVSVVERIPQLHWITQDTHYTIDRRGTVTEMLPVDQIDDTLPTVYDLSNAETGIGESTVSEEFINVLFTLHVKFPTTYDIPIAYYASPERPNHDLHVITETGWAAYLDTAHSLDDQLANLQIILDQKFTERQLQDLRYVDLRFPDRVYFK